MGGADAKGTLATQVTDQPGDISDFESCVVTVEGIWLGPAGEGTPADAGGNESGGSADGGDGRTYYEFDDPQEADLVDLRDGTTKLIDDREVPAEAYGFLQLSVSGVEGVLEDGGSAEVDTPGNAPLKFDEQFEVREGERTVFVADFTPVKRGGTGTYVLKPVASGTEVRYEDAESE